MIFCHMSDQQNLHISNSNCKYQVLIIFQIFRCYLSADTGWGILRVPHKNRAVRNMAFLPNIMQKFFDYLDTKQNLIIHVPYTLLPKNILSCNRSRV